MTPNERSQFIGRIAAQPGGEVDQLRVSELVTNNLSDRASGTGTVSEPAFAGSMPKQSDNDTGMPPARPEYAPVAYWRRAAAFLIDTLVVLTLQMSLTVIGVLWFIQSTRQIVDGQTVRVAKYTGPEPWGNDFAPLITFVVLAFLYEVVFIAVRGQTPAKELLKIKVTRVADGDKPTLRQAVLRALPNVLCRLVPGVLVIVGNLVAFITGASTPFSLRRRSVADFAAGTMVVHYDAVAVEGPIKRRPTRDPIRMRLAAVTDRPDPED